MEPNVSILPIKSFPNSAPDPHLKPRTNRPAQAAYRPQEQIIDVTKSSPNQYQYYDERSSESPSEYYAEYRYLS